MAALALPGAARISEANAVISWFTSRSDRAISSTGWCPPGGEGLNVGMDDREGELPGDGAEVAKVVGDHRDGSMLGESAGCSPHVVLSSL